MSSTSQITLPHQNTVDDLAIETPQVSAGLGYLPLYCQNHIIYSLQLRDTTSLQLRVANGHATNRVRVTGLRTREAMSELLSDGVLFWLTERPRQEVSVHTLLEIGLVHNTGSPQAHSERSHQVMRISYPSPRTSNGYGRFFAWQHLTGNLESLWRFQFHTMFLNRLPIVVKESIIS